METLQNIQITKDTLSLFSFKIFNKTKPISHDMSYDSILGPILFIIIMNDFSRASEKLFSTLYADDTSVLLSDMSMRD